MEQRFRGISLLALGLAASGITSAGPVSATPGVIQGVVTFNAPFVPDVLTVDARDSANAYTAQATAAQNGPTCIAGSQNWCYSMVVESALASGYYLRPIAYAAKSSPVFISNRVPFPPTGLVSITAERHGYAEYQLPARRNLRPIQRQRYELAAAACQLRVR